MKSSRSKAVAAVMIAMVLLAATLMGTALASPAEKAPASAEARTVSVSGSARVTLTPDIAYMNFGVQNRAADAAAARDANSAAMGKVLTALKAKGVDTDKDVKTTNFSINPIYDDKNQKVTEYQVYNTIQVKVRDLDKLGEVMEAATAAGANTADGLWFDVEDREAAYNQALVKAIENARQRAQTLAGSAGATLGDVQSVTENGSYNPGPYPIFYDRVNSGVKGSVPVSAGSMDVSASVNITFSLK